MKKYQWKKRSAGMLAALLAVSALTGCGPKEAGTAGENGTAQTGETGSSDGGAAGGELNLYTWGGRMGPDIV